MCNDLLYKDILTLIFSNETNYAYFRKYYGENEHFQLMARDYLKMKHQTQNIKNKMSMPASQIS